MGSAAVREEAGATRSHSWSSWTPSGIPRRFQLLTRRDPFKEHHPSRLATAVLPPRRSMSSVAAMFIANIKHHVGEHRNATFEQRV